MVWEDAKKLETENWNDYSDWNHVGQPVESGIYCGSENNIENKFCTYI